MPYKSKAQAAWAHSKSGLKALGGAAKVAEWDNASRGMKLPVRSKAARGILGKLKAPKAPKW